ncbi:MAG TPA: response regulator [Polyangia bacterium]|jgi:DNA-binding response OmpR family regulator|nr:response regulator [Polyangia bacterium]
MTLLIVDDDMWLCSALSRNLVRLGYAARRAASVDAALTLMATEPVSAVLTDLDLGAGGDGVELITRMRAAGSRVPALMMTGSDRAVARARLADAGLDEIAIIEKPFEFDQVMKKLAEVVPAVAASSPAIAPAPRSVPVAAVIDTVTRTFGRRVL